ncbi:MAG: hypothetical protein WCK02_11015 [Bacteroidota bacterium]
MKNIYLSFASLFLVTMAFAHPPKSVKLIYNKSEKSMSIDAEHKVKDPKDHYIKEITVFINGVKQEGVALTSQTSVEREEYNYKIGELKSGDKIKVTATCNKFGSKSQEITIE